MPIRAVLAVLAGCDGGAGAAPTTGSVVPSAHPFLSATPTPTVPPPVAAGEPMTNGDVTRTVVPPGGQEDVTWLYDVPPGVHVVGWRFGDFGS